MTGTEQQREEKPLRWIGSCLRDLKAFPAPVIDVVGYALDLAQFGRKHPNAKPLKGHKGVGVLEVVEDYDGDTFRAVYTVKFEGAVYALHAFQKKSKKGIATSAKDLIVVAARLKLAEADYLKRRKP